MKTKFLLVVVLLSTFSFHSLFAQKIVYQAEVDLGYSLGIGDWALDRVNFEVINGIRVNNYFSTGIGVGIDYYTDAECWYMPITVNAKGYLPVSNKIAPYVSLDAGYGIGFNDNPSGFYLSPALGLEVIHKIKFQVGYNLQRISEKILGMKVEGNLGAIQFKVGYIF